MLSDDRITTIRDALIWAQSYAPRALCHRLIDAEEALGSLAADLAAAEARATEAEQARDRLAEQGRIPRIRQAEAEREAAVARANTLADTLDIVLGYVNRQTLVTVVCEDIDDVMDALDEAAETLAALGEARDD